MSELPPDALQVLEVARDADEPTAADFTRVRRALAATLLASTVLTTASAAKAAAPTGLGGSAAVALKIVGIALAVAAAGGLAAWQLRGSAEEVTKQSSVVAARGPSDARNSPSPLEATVPDPAVPKVGLVTGGRAEKSAPGASVPARAQEKAPESLRRSEVLHAASSAPGASLRARAQATASKSTQRSEAVQAPSRAPATLAGSREAVGGASPAKSAISQPDQPQEPVARESERQNVEKPESEVGLMRRASRALSNNSPRDALEWLKQHATAYPKGVLAQERRALRIIALCQLGQRAAAGNARERFLNEAPRSPLAAQIRAACGTSERE